MAKSKRAVNYQTTPRKKAKAGSPSTGHAHGNVDPEREYKLKSILQESKSKYLIEWEDDEETGEEFENTWEPKRNANKQAISDWKQQKAKKREESKQNGVLSETRSSSVPRTPQPASPSKTATPLRGKGRPRRIIESSPQAAEPTRSNRYHDEDFLQSDEGIEIGESPRPASITEWNDNSASPLFVTEDVVSDHPSSGYRSAAVQLSPPPSSYLAGGYQAVSSQPVSARATQADEAPEPSQYLPDPGDTSKTTEDSTEISLAPSTPASRVPPVLVTFGKSSVTVVPDSQSLPGSSSYHPSLVGNTASSTSEPFQSAGRTERQQASATEVESEQFAIDPIEEASQALQHGELTNEPEVLVAPDLVTFNLPTTPSLNGPSATQASKRAVGFASEEYTDPHSVASRTGSSSQPVPEAATESEEVDSDHTKAGAQSVNQESTIQSQAGELDLNKIGRSEIVSALLQKPSPVEGDITQRVDLFEEEEAQATNVKTQSECRSNRETAKTRQDFEASSQLTPDGGDLVAAAGVNDQAEAIGLLQGFNHPKSKPPEPSRGSNTARIDLTATQLQPTSISDFTITPPQRRPHEVRQTYFSSQTSAPSDWSSPYPFLTQLPRLQTAGGPDRSRTEIRAEAQSQPSSQIHSHSNVLARLSHPEASDRPASQSSPLLRSSSIPQIPSNSIDVNTFGESAPPRPATLSSPLRPSTAFRSMEDSQNPSAAGGDLHASLKAMRQRHKEQKAARRGETPTSASSNQATQGTPSTSSVRPEVVLETQSPLRLKLGSPFLVAHDPIRSPSAVPAAEPLPVITQEEMNTSGRYETLLPQVHESPPNVQHNGPFVSKGETTWQAEEVDPKATNVHDVPIYLVGHQRDQYVATVNHHKEFIQRFLSSADADASLISEAKHFVDRMRLIVMHPDLDNPETFTQYDVQPSQQAIWDSECSAKFRFLKEFFSVVKGQRLNIAILARPGRILDMLETFLQGLEVPYHRPGAADRSTIDADIQATLLPTDAEDRDIEPADLVIAMDNSINPDSERIKSLRQRTESWAPLISLIIVRSIDHIERVLSPTLLDRALTRALVSGIYQTKDEAGRAQDGERAPKDTAAILAHYLTNSDHEWPLPALPSLEDLDSQTESEIEPTVSQTGMSVPVMIGGKRSRDAGGEDSDIAESNKRSRVESPAEGEVPPMLSTVNPLGIDITHISDSVEKTTQSIVADGEAEVSSSALSANERRLQDLLRERQERLDEHVRVLGDLQYRYEEQRAQLLEATTERNAAIATAQQAVTRLTEESNKMSNLRTDNSTLKEQLKEANAKLLDHSIPERAEFEALRQATLQATAEKEKAERRLEQANKDTAYVRDLYQDASSRAQTNATQATELENQLAVAQNRATGEQAKLRMMSVDNFSKSLQEENKKLKVMLKERETGLRFRDEEIAKLKEASRGKMGTRGTSVPRSPRLGNVTPNVGSRQTSPAAGDLRGRSALLHPLRNG